MRRRPRATCWLAQFSTVPCDGRLDRAHLIPKRVLKAEVLNGYVCSFCGARGSARCRSAQTGKPTKRDHDVRYHEAHAILWDPRCWAWGCRGHHEAFDYSRTLRIPRLLLPPELDEYADEHGIGWWLDREYGQREMAA